MIGENTGLMTTAEVCDYLRISRTTLWRMTKAGTFPRPLKLNGATGRYRREWVVEWVRQQEDNRPKG